MTITTITTNAAAETPPITIIMGKTPPAEMGTEKTTSSLWEKSGNFIHTHMYIKFVIPTRACM